MKPTINLYCEDCLPAMQKMANNQYILAIVDPPYGIGNYQQQTGDLDKYHIDSLKKYGKLEWNKHTPTKEYFKELERISKHQIIWGANYYNCFNGLMGAIIWDKKQPTDRYSTADIASCSLQKRITIFKYLWGGFLQENMKQKQNRIHPTEKPVALYKWLLNNYAKEGGKILDTHGGSMSIAIACWDAGYDLDLYEIDRDYFEAGKKRLEIHMKRPRPFFKEQDVQSKNPKLNKFF